eukprot:11697342-Alexandrium_andersonii.AAC.1
MAAMCSGGVPGTALSKSRADTRRLRNSCPLTSSLQSESVPPTMSTSALPSASNASFLISFGLALAASASSLGGIGTRS